MEPKYITVHCSATQNDLSVTVDRIRQWHLDRGWSDIGYSFVITTDGVLHQGRPITKQGAHVAGHNKDNIGICLVGGIDSNGKSVMNFNEFQLGSLRILLQHLMWKYHITKDRVKGHRDWSPDKDGDGVVEKHEWLKDCPCFDVQHWLDTQEAIFYKESQ
jgi:N-acetyl-anhydromuramyl-L-alanine amidase AmpD